MKTNNISTGIKTHRNNIFRMVNHEVHIDRHFGNFAQVFDKERRQGNIFYIAAIHNIDVIKRRRAVHRLNLFAKAG